MRRYRYRAPRPPKMPKPKRPDRPLGRDLRAVYKGLLTADQGQRLASLAKAMQWYDAAQPYLLFTQGALTPEQLKDDDVAAKCRARGISSTFNYEKETSFVMALKRYQKIFGKLKPPKIDSYLDMLKENEGRLQEKQERLEQRFGTVTDIIMKALHPVNAEGNPVEIKVGEIQDVMRIDPERSTLTLHRNTVQRLRIKRHREGVLPMLMEVLDPVSRMCSMEPEKGPDGRPTGKYVLSLQKQKQKIYELLNNVIHYAKQPDSPRRLVRAPLAGVVRERVGAPRAVVPKGPRIAGVFKPGSISAVMYEILLEQKENKTLVFADLASMLKSRWQTTQPLAKLVPQMPGQLAKLDSVGQVTGKWRIEVENGTARLIENQPAA